MRLSDEALRQALADRSGNPELAGVDLAAAARVIAARHGNRRRPWAWSGLAAAAAAGVAIALAVVVASLIAIPRSTGQATAPLGDAATADAAGTTGSPSPSPGAPTPAPSTSVSGCEKLDLAPYRCAALVGQARKQADDPSAIVSINVGRTAPSGGVTLGFPMTTWTIDLTFDDGRHQHVELACGGGAIPGISDRLCNADARIFIRTGVDQDVPCGTEPAPDGPCATPPPTPRPASVRGSTPIRVASLDIPLDHVGHYEVPIGAGSLADGYLSDLSARLLDETPSAYWIDGGITIDVRSDIPGRPPIGSRYRAPYRGPEPVHAWLVFDVTDLAAPEALLRVRDLVIR